MTIVVSENAKVGEDRQGRGVVTMLTDLYVIDKINGEIHRVGDNIHDSLHIMDNQVHYLNIQNGDGGSGYNENGAGYVILKSDCGSLEDEFGIIDDRFEEEIRRYLNEENK